jgi:menaquinone-dependent protoporphyrinogen oxidase
MSRILVSFASRSGTTREVAQALGAELERLGHDVDVLPCRRSPSSYHYDTVVLGSAMHRGQWLPEALAYLHAEAPDLGERPTWLFQTGPCGDGEAEGHVGVTPVPARVVEQVRDIGAAGPATFSRPDPDLAGHETTDRWVATGPCFGPFGSEDGVRAWAEMIDAFAHDRHAASCEDDLGGGAGEHRTHASLSVV